jgi:hypothetical protein
MSLPLICDGFELKIFINGIKIMGIKKMLYTGFEIPWIMK